MSHSIRTGGWVCVYEVHPGVVQSDIVKSRRDCTEEGVEFVTFAVLRAYNNIYT